jgi:glycosyltransferase involved in cell wall biosynthesis
MMPLRVMQLGSPTALYGAERWILALIRHLDQTQVESVVAVIRDDPRLEAALCRRAGELGFQTRIFEAYGRANWAAVSGLRAYILENDIQVLHTHGYKTDVIGLLATMRTPCHLVSTPHGWSAQAGPALALYETLDRAIFPLFDAVAPLSEGIFKDLARWPGLRRKLHLIRNGVDIGEIDAIPAVAPELLEWRNTGNFVVGYIGQLIARKGLSVLLEAFARLDLPNKRLAILGEGSQRQQLEAQASALGLREQVAFFGFRADRLAFLKGFDVFALPSLLEGIPRCLMEAMSANVPVVASDIPGCTDLIKHDDTGLLFKPDDVAALAACLTACASAEVRARLARSGREFVVANYSAAAMANRYSELYVGLVGGAAGVRAQHG